MANKNLTDPSHIAIYPTCPFYCFIMPCESLSAFNESVVRYLKNKKHKAPPPKPPKRMKKTTIKQQFTMP